MSLIWAVIQSKRFKETEAKNEVLRQGFRVFLPMMTVVRMRMGQKPETVMVPRFATFLFAEFDVRTDQWEALGYAGKAAVRPIVKVWCNANGDPRPVPIRAIQAMQAYDPPPPRKPDEPVVYTEGQAVNVYLAAGRPQQGVFVGYERGKAKVSVWILGRDVIMPVPENAIEPIESETLTKQAC